MIKMANKKKKKNKKHSNRRKRAVQQTVQPETQDVEVQGFFTKRTLICACVIFVCVLFAFFPEKWLDNFIVKALGMSSFGVIIFMCGVLCYRNYTSRAVKILYWIVFTSTAVSIYLISWRGWMLVEFLALTILTLYACAVYMQENRKGDKKFVKKGKYRKITLDSFLPISMVLLLRACLVMLEFSRYSYINQVAVFGLGTGIGVAIALGLIVWLCLSGYTYLERKGGESHSTALTAVLILCASIVFGWWAVAIPNQTFELEQNVVTCEIQDKNQRHRSKGMSNYEIYVKVKGEEYSLEVTSEEFEDYHIGDMVDVKLSKGLFGLEYLYIPRD